jgi:hypothetical protein
MNVSFEPLTEDDPLRPLVEQAERALRESVAQALAARGEILLGSGVSGCSCDGPGHGVGLAGLTQHISTYEHLLASIFQTVYIQTWPIPAEKIIAALRPRVALLGVDVVEAVEAILDSKEGDALALAFRLVAQTAVLRKGGF